MAPLPRKPGAVGSFKLPGWPGGKSVELLFQEEEEDSSPRPHKSLRGARMRWEYNHHSTALASRSSKEMQIVPDEDWLLLGFGLAWHFPRIIPALSPAR